MLKCDCGKPAGECIGYQGDLPKPAPVKHCYQCYYVMPIAKHNCPNCGSMTLAGLAGAERRENKQWNV